MLKMSFNDSLSRHLIEVSGAKVSGANVSVTTIMVNCHLSIVSDCYGDHCAELLFGAYRTLSLSTIFQSLEDYSDLVIDCLGNGLTIPLDTSPCCYFTNSVVAQHLELDTAASDLLLAFRFPLRLSLDSDAESGRKFREANRSCKDWGTLLKWNLQTDWLVPVRVNLDSPYRRFTTTFNRPFNTGHSSLFEAMLYEAREVASELTLPANWQEVVEERSKFSSGVCRDARNISAKRQHLDHCGTFARFIGQADLFYSRSDFNRSNVSKITFVPKNWKTKRTIGELDSVRSYYAQGVRALLIESMPESWQRSIDLSDQYRSRALTYLSSKEGRYATLDLSSASDRVPACLVSFLFPNWWPVLNLVRDHEFELDGSRLTAYMYSCAGNATTFVIETFVFYCLTEAVRRYSSRIAKEYYLKSRIYGDDIIVDDRLADGVARVLELFNASINLKKSYSGSIHYRESCGAEYLDGFDCCTHYFPRSFKGSLIQLVMLEHALYSYPSARSYLTKLVYAKQPRMTSHLVGTPCTDLWADVDLPIYCDASQALPMEVACDYPVKRYYTFVPKWIKADVDLSRSLSLYKEALSGPLYIDDISVSRIDRENKWVDSRVDKDGTPLDGRYILTVD